MAIIKVMAYPGQIAVIQSVEGISNLHAVMISPPGVAEATSGQGWRGLGIARGTVVSGQLARVMTHGMISGVICAVAVQAGDRLMAEGNTSGPGLASGPGLVTPFNTITPVGAISGYVTGVISGYIDAAISGYVPAPKMDLASGLVGGALTVQASDGALGWVSGLASGLTGIRAPQFSSGSIAAQFTSGSIASIFNSGLFVGTAFNTGRVLGRALTSGGIGSGIQMYVCVE